METLDCSFELKSLDDVGIFEGYASVFGNVDKQRDIVMPGAFGKTLAKTEGRIPILFEHRETIGVGLEASEDKRGLKLRGQLAIGVQRGLEARELMRMGAMKGMSIGYLVPERGWEMDGEVRKLTEIDLKEVSIVTFPANTRALVTRVKSEMTERDFEEFLRDAGFSRTDAKTIIASGYRNLKSQRDAALSEADEAQVRDALNELSIKLFAHQIQL